MEPDTTIIARPTPAPVWLQPTLTEQLAGAGAIAQAAQRTPDESHSPAAAAALAEPAEPRDLDCLGNHIAELSSRIDAATYELLCYLHQFNRQHGWEGFRSCAHWLNWRTGLDLGAAREKLRVAAALAELPHLSAAMACGRLSYSKVRALTRVAAPATEARLLAVACGSTAAQVERLVRGWRQADQAAQADGEQVRLASRMLSTQVDDDGMLVLRARLTPEVGAVLLRAVEAALEQVPAPAAGADGEEATLAQRRADALGLVAESALAGGLDPGNLGERFQVTVHVPADTLAAREPASTPPCVAAATRAASETLSQPVTAAPPTGRETTADGASGSATAAPHVAAETPEASAGACECVTPPAGLDAGQAVIDQAGGLHLGREATRRISCDAALVALCHGADGEVLDVGRRTRAIPSALRRALLDRDRNQCQFPGCTSRRCDAHHVVHWADGGETRLQNLVLCCRFHHRALHEEGFQVVADGDGQFRFLRPDGVPLPAEPPVACWEDAPLAPTGARLAAAGVSIGPHTATPEWYGESLDLAAALDVLWQPPAREAPAAVACGDP